MDHNYYIDKKKITISISNEDLFFFGDDEVLSQKFTDVTSKMPWFDLGYKILNLDKFIDSKKIRISITDVLKNILGKIVSNKNLEKFTLEKYHNFVNDSQHEQVIKQTKRLYPNDFGFNSTEFIDNISNYFGKRFSFKNPVAQNIQWIIVRINRPKSFGFNPAHKDIYESFDQYQIIPKMLNIWIPVCGVNHQSGLPVVPKSHLISESKIKRCKAGSVINNTRYTVNTILEWDGKKDLTTLSPNEDQILIFSSHLIHGLGVNNNDDATRISLEFRLYA
jgi:hypothetical protein